MGDSATRARLATDPGLCAGCRHRELLASARSVFVRCGLARTDPSFPRYPALPVLSCRGFERRPTPPDETSLARVAPGPVGAPPVAPHPQSDDSRRGGR